MIRNSLEEAERLREEMEIDFRERRYLEEGSDVYHTEREEEAVKQKR